jgi:gamma-glutamylcyclotransferase
MSVIYFAYGSNMDFNQLQKREISFEFLGKATLHNFKLQFNKIASKKEGVGYANISSQIGKSVEGLLFKTENIEILDKFEGYPNHYEKQKLYVLFNGENTEVVVYVARTEKTKEGLMPEKEYLNRLLTAKEYLSEQYYEQLKSTETID